MSVLKGRPERASQAGTGKSRAVLPDDATVKITTRVSNALHTRMKIVAAQNRISIEDAYREAVSDYLRTR